MRLFCSVLGKGRCIMKMRGLSVFSKFMSEGIRWAVFLFCSLVISSGGLLGAETSLARDRTILTSPSLSSFTGLGVDQEPLLVSASLEADWDENDILVTGRVITKYSPLS